MKYLKWIGWQRSVILALLLAMLIGWRLLAPQRNSLLDFTVVISTAFDTDDGQPVAPDELSGSLKTLLAAKKNCDPILDLLVADLHQQIESGSSLNRALDRHPGFFCGSPAPLVEA